MRRLLLTLIYAGLVYGCATGGSSSGGNDLRTDPTTNEAATANLNLAVEYMRTGDMETALEKLDRAYDADPNYYFTHNIYGLLYQRLGRPELAEKHFKRAIALNSTDSGSKNNYGLFLCQNKRFAEAEQVFLSAAANPLYETPEVAWSNAGTCALMNGQIDAAERHFRQALTLNPEVPAALIQMAELSFTQQNFLSARGYLQRYQAVARHTPVSLLLGIRIERQLGDKNAVSSYELLLRNTFPDSAESKQINQPAGQ
jgi:type IV pilus assembly protein PilF